MPEQKNDNPQLKKQWALPLASGLLMHLMISLTLLQYILIEAPDILPILQELHIEASPALLRIVSLSYLMEGAMGMVWMLVTALLALDGAVIAYICKKKGSRYSWVWVCLVAVALSGILLLCSNIVSGPLEGVDMSRLSGVK